MRLLPLVFLSGACALVYQVAWTRDFRLVFGASTPASAAVVAIFVGGLGLGAWRLGARAERSPTPLRLYAWLELTIAASSAATPLLLALATRAYIALGGTVVLGLPGATVVRLLLATLVLAVPTVLMGGTLPALARAATAGEGDASRRRVGLLYGVNTLGAVAGCVAANFVLLERLGTHRTLWSAAVVNALVGAVALRAWSGARVPVGPSDLQAPPAKPAAPAAFVLAAAAVVGFAFFLMELVFTRMLVPLLGGTVYTFGLVLAVALLGIGIGGALYAALFARRAATLVGFATTCLLEALGLAVPYALGDHVALFALYVRGLGVEHGFAGYVAGWSLVTAVVVLPASIAAGVQFPVLVALLGRGRREVARHVGLAYAWNTLGAIAGAVAGGFGLMPALTAPGCWRLATEVLVVTAVAATALARRFEARWFPLGVRLALAASVLLLLRASTGPTTAWRHSPIGVGLVELSVLDSREDSQRFLRKRRMDIEWDADGVESTVAILHNAGYSFSTNAKSDGACRLDAATQVMGGLLGAILHPAPASAMVIGLGSGSTAGWLAQVPTIDRVDVVELEPAMLEVARRCAPINEHALENPKLHVIRGDAREILSVTRQRYDIVFSEPSNPYRAGVASLYTREFYRRAMDHMQDGGLFLQWVQGYQIDAPTMRTIFATMASVFPYVEVWQLEEPDLALVASRTPIVKDAAAMRGRIASGPLARALHHAWGVDDMEGVLAHFVARDSFVRALAAEGTDPLNTDDRPVVEFGFARVLSDDVDVVNVATVQHWVTERDEGRPDVVRGSVDWARVALEHAEIPCAADSRPGSMPYELPDGASEEDRTRVRFDSVGFFGLPEKAVATWDEHPTEPATPVEAVLLARAGVRARDPRAATWVEQLATTHPIEALVLRALLLEDDKRYGEAADALERALVAFRTDPWPSLVVMEEAPPAAHRLTQADRSLAPRMLGLLMEPFALELLRDMRLSYAESIAALTGSPADCRRVLEQEEPYTRWNEAELRSRRDCYRALGDPREAIAQRELAQFVDEGASKLGL